MEADREIRGFITGGNLKELPLPLHRQFPGKKKRKVEVRITCYQGCGGRHYYASLREERNGFICPCKGMDGELHVHVAWDDKESEGLFESQKFNTKFQAEAWIKKMFKKHFSEETHVLMQDDGRPMVRFIYHDGD